MSEDLKKENKELRQKIIKQEDLIRELTIGSPTNKWTLKKQLEYYKDHAGMFKQEWEKSTVETEKIARATILLKKELQRIKDVIHKQTGENTHFIAHNALTALDQYLKEEKLEKIISLIEDE